MAGRKGKSGRKAHNLLHRDASYMIANAAPVAAKYISDCLAGRVKKYSAIRADLAKWTLEQVLGKARIKLEIPSTGKGITFQQLIVLAQQQQLKPGHGVTHAQHMLPDAGVDAPVVVDGDEAQK